MDKKNIKGISIIEALVCLVIIGIGFVAMLQLSSFSINAMDRSMEKNKLNFLSEMVLEDMIGDPNNVSNYTGFNPNCNYSTKGGTKLFNKSAESNVFSWTYVWDLKIVDLKKIAPAAKKCFLVFSNPTKFRAPSARD